MNKEKLRIKLIELVAEYGANKKMRHLKDYGADCSDLHQRFTDAVYAFYEKEKDKDKEKLMKVLKGCIGFQEPMRESVADTILEVLSVDKKQSKLSKIAEVLSIHYPDSGEAKRRSVAGSIKKVLKEEETYPQKAQRLMEEALNEYRS